MQMDAQPGTESKTMIRVGWVLGALPVLALLMSGVMKLVKPASVVESFNTLGWPARYAFGLGILELTCTAIYLIPRTTVLGAILLTGYLGGAVATHTRLGDPSGAFSVVFGVLLWAGIGLRDARLRALLPFRK
jgi:hypothetical protein